MRSRNKECKNYGCVESLMRYRLIDSERIVHVGYLNNNNKPKRLNRRNTLRQILSNCNEHSFYHLAYDAYLM